VLEAEDHAGRRGARVRAECAGFGAAGSDPATDGIRDSLGRAMRAALAGSGREIADAVSLHGDGGVATDLGEAAAFRALAAEADARPAAYATKGAHGNLFSAAGPVEVVGAVMALGAGAVPPSRNCEEIDPACGLSLDTHGLRLIPGIRTVLVNAVGAYGEVASLAITRAE
jgi:3-oxoacyl-(acyl-carrier-protein) synthase